MSRHLSEDQICRAVAGQATIDEQRHVNECPDCQAELERSWTMLSSYRQAVSGWADRHVGPSAQSLEVRSADRRRRREWAFAAASLAAVLAALLTQGQRQPTAFTPSEDGETSDASVIAENDFFPLDYSTVPITNGRIVRLEVPSSSVTAFGVDSADLVRPRPGAVLADVVVGEDGLARAVRFVRPSVNNSTQQEYVP
jgi:hypothetical protein